MTLVLCFSASAKACGSRWNRGKGEMHSRAKMGLHTKVSKVIAKEDDFGDAGVVL